MLVINEEGLVAVHPFPDDVGEVADGKDVGMGVELTAVIQRETVALLYLGENPAQAGLFNISIHNDLYSPCLCL